MKHSFKLTLLVICFCNIAFCQDMTLHTVRGTFQLSGLEAKNNWFRAYLIGHKRPMPIPGSMVLNYVNEKGETIIVNDSDVFSNIPRFNKVYTNLKPIQNVSYKRLTYNSQSIISHSAFICILKRSNNQEIQKKLRTIKRNKRIRTGLFIASGVSAIAGISSIFIGLGNSSGRNSYPQEQRAQAAFQVNMGLGLVALSASFSLSTIIINLKNHKIIHEDLVNRYNQQL